MRILEARFHPQRKNYPSFIVVGHLVWKRSWPHERPVFQPVDGAVPEPAICKLNYLIEVTRPDCFTRLQALRSLYWSFVEVRPIAAAAPRLRRTGS